MSEHHGLARGSAGLHIVVTVNSAWNIWNFRRQLLASLLADGCRITVLAPDHEAVAELQAMGCDCVSLKMDQQGLNPLSETLLLGRFVHHFRQLRPDLVLGFTIKNNIFGSIAARWLGIPFVPNVTGLGTAFLSSKLLHHAARWLYRRAFGACPTVFFQNADDMALFLAEGMVTEGQATLVAGSGIDLVEFAQRPPAHAQPPRFLMIARLLRDKGVSEYVEAARIIGQRGLPAKFQLLGPAGSANRTAFSADQAREWEASCGIEYLGTRSDVRPFIEQADCVVLPSYREGAPRTLIEAAAMGRPLIATDVPGCRDVVDPGVTGFLCEVRNAASLAAAMERFLAMPPEERSAMGARGRAKMEAEYDVAQVIKAYRAVIERLFAGPEQSRRKAAD